jgi:hypothetical protein
MTADQIHSFHIPVMGISFTIDTPLKVARYGISSVVSLVDDVLIEDMRAHYSNVYGKPYEHIKTTDFDYRAKRIAAYLDLLDEILTSQFDELRSSGLEGDSELVKYLNLLPDDSPLRDLHDKYKSASLLYEKKILEAAIVEQIKPGAMDVNIMTKLDKVNKAPDGSQLPSEFSDALAALRGFAQSRLSSSVVFSAGFNPRLYSYLEQFQNFYPDANGNLHKKVILKVSDFRSALVQGKFLAKKGIWISEFRIESGLNCGGHAFATDGLLMGPILQEFKQQRQSLREELFSLCLGAWKQKGISEVPVPPQKISFQGGVGTANEHKFLLEYYGVDSVGWGTPFLLVPEATMVDEETLQKLITAKAADLYLSNSSPLGVPFNNLRQSASERERVQRLKAGKPGSPCIKKYLISNAEFSQAPVCTASRKYLGKKLTQLATVEKYAEDEYDTIVAKACLCEDLAATAYITHGIKTKIKPSTAICPSPNLAYFSSSFTLKQMVDHIYGRVNVLNSEYRPNVFLNELKLYIDYFKDRVTKANLALPKEEKYWADFKSSLMNGIGYYGKLIPKLYPEDTAYKKKYDVRFVSA